MYKMFKHLVKCMIHALYVQTCPCGFAVVLRLVLGYMNFRIGFKFL
uniref:Uncharacterized protein n=1 Tax=Anguilla anguilla TaxID=7936 RepID=A0A0E9UH69_ANGAN